MANDSSHQIHQSAGPVVPQNHPVVISSLLECIIGTDTLSCWKKTNTKQNKKNPYVDVLTFVKRAIMAGKAKWKR